MFRLLIFLAALALAAWGLTWLADNPGVVTVTWRGIEYQVSLMLALGAVLALAVVLSIVWAVLRFIFRIPSLVSLASRARKREKGFLALSRGMIAVGAGDARAAAKHASEASRLIAHEPMTKLLQAQSAQLAGDRASARSRRIMRCSTITRPMASACAACISRRGAPATTRRRSNTRCAPTRARPPPGRVRRCSTTAPGAATGRARWRPSISTPPPGSSTSRPRIAGAQ